MVTTTKSDAATAEHVQALGAVFSITADSGSTDGGFTVMDGLVPPGFENGLHTHDQAELFHVIDGEIALYVEDDVHDIGAGQTGHVSGGQLHGFRVAGDEPARVIFTLSPGGFEEFIRAIGESVETRELPEPREVTEADLEGVFAVGAQYGLEFEGPLPDRD